MNALLQPLTVPDLWQRDAVQHLRAGRDVVVDAPTGAGKTYIFELYQPQVKGQSVFTVPTRALANDKLAEWRARNWDVGIATGDLALKLDARTVVATLETQRARFLRREGPRLLVVDEYQMIGDAARGVNYELAIALAPRSTQLLMLSGSVANPAEVVAWLRRIGRDAVLVSHTERPVPLTEVDLERLPSRGSFKMKGYWPQWIANALKAELGPILLFAPRRLAAEELAQTLASQLPPDEPLVLSPEQEMIAGPKLAKLLRARVAFHHSGLGYALRAGVIEPLAKNGHLRVVVATTGLAAGINFSMRSVAVTDMRYRVGNFEKQVQPDELVQMFGRAGRRGLDETGHVLFSSQPPRLLDARPRQLRRATQLDWPTLIAVMQGAAEAGEAPFDAALELNRSLFTPQAIPLGIEHSRETGPRACGLMVDAERARFIRRTRVEMLNSAGEWELQPKVERRPLREVWVWDAKGEGGGRWRAALSVARTVEVLGYGRLCRLDAEAEASGASKRFGRELVLGKRRDGGLELAPWLREQLIWRQFSMHGLATEILPRLAELVVGAAKANARGRWEEVGNEPKAGSEKHREARIMEPGAGFEIAAIFPRGEQLIAQLDYGRHVVAAFVDAHGKALAEPPTREVGAICCESCDQRDWCAGAAISKSPAWAWRKLGLIEPEGRPTRRGVIFSFFHHGEGLAVAAALEDESYPLEELVFDLANLRGGPRFAGDEALHGGRLGALCQTVYERADFEGYLEMGVPTEYGAGAAEAVRDLVENHVPRSKLLAEGLRLGDLERAVIEWRSVLRQISLAPDYPWERWRALKRLAARYVEGTESPTPLTLPALTGAQQRRR